MRRALLFFSALTLGLMQVCLAQNLVPNSDFESYSTCNPDLGSVDDWNNPTGATTDYYNACVPFGLSVPSNILGNQNARSGVGYAGFIAYEDGGLFGPCPFTAFSTGWREYAQVQLTSPLSAGMEYCVQFFLSRADETKYGTENFGVYFSSTPVAWPDSVDLPYTPQVVWTGGVVSNDTGWTEISGSYTATGGEQYIVIGNFDNDASTTVTCENSTAFNPYCYYYLDDVFVGPSGSCPTVVTCAMTVDFMADHKPCGAPTASITAIPDAGAGGYTYVWSTGATGATLSGVGNGSYTVTVTDTNGCEAIDTYVLDLPQPPAVDIGPNDTVCQGTGYTWTATGGGTYLWSTGATTASITVTAFVTEAYSVTVTNDDGCSAVDVASLTVIPAPLTFIEPLESPFCDKDEEVTLSGGPNGGTFSGPGVSGNTFDPVVAGPGTFELVYSVTDINGCTGSDTITVVVEACTGILEDLQLEGVNVFPNPFSDVLTVEIETDRVAEIELRLTDVLGRKVLGSWMKAVPGVNRVELSVPEEVSAGVYFLNVMMEGRMAGVKVVRE